MGSDMLPKCSLSDTPMWENPSPTEAFSSLQSLWEAAELGRANLCHKSQS